MSRLSKFAVVVFVLLLVLLPLYEFADVGEHWAFDGEIVCVVFSLLFIAAALVACRIVRRAWIAFARRIDVVRAPRTYGKPSRSLTLSRDNSSLFLVLCDLRI